MEAVFLQLLQAGLHLLFSWVSFGGSENKQVG